MFGAQNGPYGGYASQQDLLGSSLRQQGISKQEAIDQIANQIISLTAQLEKLTLDDPLPSPTQRQLNNSEALQNAWLEFNTVWKLTGK